MKSSLKLNNSKVEYGIRQYRIKSPNDEQIRSGKKVNIQQSRHDTSKNISITTSQNNQQTRINEHFQLLVEKDDNGKTNEQDDSEPDSPVKINNQFTNKNIKMKDLIQSHTHYKIGVNEELDHILLKMGKRNSIQVEQEQDLDGWYKRQLTQKIQNIIFQEEEETKKEMKNKLLDDILAQDTPELNQKIISSIMRDRSTLQMYQTTASGLRTQRSLKSPIKNSIKKLMHNKSLNKELFSEEYQEAQKEGPLHITAATSTNLLRIYNPYWVIENQEVKKRQKTENIISKIVIDKVKKEGYRLKNGIYPKIQRQEANESELKNKDDSQNNKQNTTAAELQAEENLRVLKLIDIGKQQARNTLKNFKGLQNFYLENVLHNDNIKRQLEESQKVPKNKLFYLKGDNYFAPFSEIEQIYLPKYIGTFEKLELARVDEYELRICIANQVDLIKEKQLEINELQSQLDNIGNPSIFNFPNSNNVQSSKNITIPNQQQTPKSSLRLQNQNEVMKISKRKELIKEQISILNSSIEILKQELQSLENKMQSYQDNIRQLKMMRTKIRTYIKTTLLTMMQKDLTLFINQKKPIDLSLPKIVSTLIKIGENVYNENFPIFLDQSQRDLIIEISYLRVEQEKIKEKDLKEINDIKLPANTQSVLSQLSYQCSKQCITQEVYLKQLLDKNIEKLILNKAGKRIKEITKEILSVKKPIFKLDEGTHTHTMQYENVIQNYHMPKNYQQTKQDIEEKKDAVLSRLEKRETITKYLQKTVDKIKELEETELDRLEKSFSALKNDQIAYLKNILISIFGIIRGCEQLQYFLQYHKFKKQLLSGNNFTNKEKIDLINLFRDKKQKIPEILSEESRSQSEESHKESEIIQVENKNNQVSRHAKFRDRSQSIQRKENIKVFQDRNKNHIENGNLQRSMMTDLTFYNTFMKSLNKQQEDELNRRNSTVPNQQDTINSNEHVLTSHSLRSQLLNKDISISQQNQPLLISERGILGGSSYMINTERQNIKSKKVIEQIKLNKIVSFEKFPPQSPISQFGRKVSIQLLGQQQQSAFTNRLTSEH